MASQIDLGDYRRLTSRILTAAVDQSAWHGFLANLSATTGGGTFTHILGKDTARDLHLGDLNHGYDPAWGPPYYQHYHAINPWLRSAAAHPVGRAIYSFDMCPDDEFERSEFYSDWVHPHEDMIAGGSIVIAKTPTQVFKLGACIRRRDREKAEVRFITILDLLAEPLAHAWDVSRRIGGDSLFAVSGRMAAASSAAMILVDVDGRLRFANAAAQNLLAAGSHLQLSMSSTVRLTDPAAEAQLGRLLLTLRKGGTGWWWGPCGTLDLSISALPSGVPGEGLTGLIIGAGRPCLLLVATEREAANAAGALASRLGLTRAEAEVALALAEGLTPGEIAEARRASLNTVRNQIKAAMWKCEVSRQTQLVALVFRQKR